MIYLKTFEKFDNYLIVKIADMYGLNDKIQYLDSGFFGDAYKVGDKVIKITTDKEEYLNANKLRTKPITKYIINYYDAREIENSNEKKQLYALLMDFVETPIKNEKWGIFDIIGFYNENFKYTKEYKEIFIDSNTFNKKLDEYDKDLLEFIEKSHYLILMSMPIEEVKSFLRDINNMRLECKKLNIPLADLNSGNIGKKDGHLVYFDVGCEYAGGYSKKLKSFSV